MAYNDSPSAARQRNTPPRHITAQANYDRVQGLTLGETYIVTPNLVNSFHATGTSIVGKADVQLQNNATYT